MVNIRNEIPLLPFFKSNEADIIIIFALLYLLFLPILEGDAMTDMTGKSWMYSSRHTSFTKSPTSVY
jgi:hypothetical protein